MDQPVMNTTSRRTALVAAATGAVALSACAHRPAQEPSARRTFVLVHGAWHGGWCWKFVRQRLESAGHRVYTPTLTGLAERSHLLSTSLTLQTHIDDIVNLFRWEDIDDAVLVAHSYGGWPVSGAVERIAERVRALVFVDAFVPQHGQRVMDTNSGQFQQQLRDALARGDAGRPVPDALKSFGVKEAANAAWVQAKMTPQPASVSLQPIELTGARERIRRKTYVRAGGFVQPRFDEYLARARADGSWRTHVLAAGESGHDVMVDAPDRLTAILQEAVE